MILKFLLPSFYLFPFLHLIPQCNAYKKSVRTAAPRILKFGTNMGVSYKDMTLYCVIPRDSAFSCLSFHLSIFSFSQIKNFVTNFSATTSPRILKFGTKHWLYCVKENQHSHACHSLYQFFFLIKIHC